MKLSGFDYQLPPERIAAYPLPTRSESRLLSLDLTQHHLSHHVFKELPDLLKAGDLLVFNNTKVLPARLYGNKSSGGRVEMLMERLLNDKEMLAHCRASHLKPGHDIILNQEIKFKVLAHDRLYHLRLEGPYNLLDVFHTYGHMPLPPYLEREDEAADQERYQTIYAHHSGSAAAPTAGLHFDEDLFKKLQEKGIHYCFVTLHVGAGTFQPVKTENIEEHHMHSEIYDISPEAAEIINRAKQEARRIIAVGTTSVRTLETASEGGRVKAGRGETRLFIYPGYSFKMIDGMITNFHLPKSSLLMLVAAFAGLDFIKEAYALAIQEKYRFFSYGDAMLILK